MERRDVRIELTDVPRFTAKPPRLTPKEREAFNEWFQASVAHGWIRPSTARISSSLLFVPKKNGRLRPCINYIRLNAITKPRIYAPRNDRYQRSSISAHTWYSKIDLKDAFYHLRIWEPDRWKTAFRTPHGLYEATVLMFGLKNAPGEFQMWIEEVIATVLGDNVCVHIDDILIHSDTREECAALTKKVLDLLSKHRINVNHEKSVYMVESVEYCGFRYSKTRCTPLIPRDDILSWPEPRNPTQLRSFLGLTNQLRDHVPRYGLIAPPLYKPTGKTWVWTSQQSNAFHRLKVACANYLATVHHRPDQRCTLTTDASLFGIAGILSQRGAVTAIWSRSLTPAERNYTTNERELLAVVESLHHFVFYLDTSPGILVRTDNMINATNLKPNQSNRRLNRWINTLQAHPLTWQHLPGERNPADAPSRRPDYVHYIKGGEDPT